MTEPDPIPRVYESMILDRGGVRLAEHHLHRLSAAGVEDHLLTRLAAAIASYADPASSFKLRIETDGRDFWCARLPIRPREAVRLASVIGFDPLARHRELKLVDRSWAGLASSVAAERGANEALIVSPAGLVGETTTSNIFVKTAPGRWCTPPVAGLVPGVVRGWLCETIAVDVRPVQLRDLAAAPSIFLSTAGRGIVPVLGVDDTTFHLDPETEDLHRRWLELPRSLPVWP